MSTVSPIRKTESIDVAIGRRVHTLMWEQRIKNKDLATLLALESTGVGKKLRAEAKFSIEQLVAVARALNTSVAYLVGETENPHPVTPGGGSLLPGLDSNQEPIGSQSAPESRGIVRPNFGRKLTVERISAAPVTAIRG